MHQLSRAPWCCGRSSCKQSCSAARSVREAHLYVNSGSHISSYCMQDAMQHIHLLLCSARQLICSASGNDCRPFSCQPHSARGCHACLDMYAIATRLPRLQPANQPSQRKPLLHHQGQRLLQCCPFMLQRQRPACQVSLLSTQPTTPMTSWQTERWQRRIDGHLESGPANVSGNNFKLGTTI